jgi:ribosome maturation factor RimP
VAFLRPLFLFVDEENMENRVLEFLNPLLDEENAFLVEMKILSRGKEKIIDIYADTDEGIQLDSCARINRKLGNLLEEHDVFTSAYRVEVSSPGLSRPLSHPRQFIKAKNKKLDIKYKNEDGVYLKETHVFHEIKDNVYVFDNKKIRKENIKEIKYHLSW